MIMSVSMFMIFMGAATPVRVVNLSMDAPQAGRAEFAPVSSRGAR
jgi:hypothetical protein